MKKHLAIFVALMIGFCMPSQAHAFAPEPGALQHGFGFTMTFTNVDQIYTLPSIVYPGDVDLIAPDNSTFEVLRFLPEVADNTQSNTAIVFSQGNLPVDQLSNHINLPADFVDGVTVYTACHCDIYNIPTGRVPVVTVVPLPGSAALGGLGVAAIVIGRWLRTRRIAIA